MTGNRNRSAWIWLAVATLAVVCVPRGQFGIGASQTYAHPVLQFLAAHSGSESLNPRAFPRLLQQSVHASGTTAFTAGPTWQAILPVLFIGLIAPLSVVCALSLLSVTHTPKAPALASLFQRPPPSLL